VIASNGVTIGRAFCHQRVIAIADQQEWGLNNAEA
jgi:hypothetical protein